MSKVIDDLLKKKKFGVEWWRWLSKREGLEVSNEGEQHVERKKQGFQAEQWKRLTQNEKERV
jgi:hypothetical protein